MWKINKNSIFILPEGIGKGQKQTSEKRKLRTVKVQVTADKSDFICRFLRIFFFVFALQNAEISPFLCHIFVTNLVCYVTKSIFLNVFSAIKRSKICKFIIYS